MDDHKLRDLLEQLHIEIEHTENVDEKGKNLLRETGADIRELLERAEGGSSSLHPTTKRRIEETIAHLEVTHPDLTLMLSELLSILSNAGI
jgi:hypothetical protein